MTTQIRNEWERTIGLVREKQFPDEFQYPQKAATLVWAKKIPQRTSGPYPQAIPSIRRKKNEKIVLACMCGWESCKAPTAWFIRCEKSSYKEILWFAQMSPRLPVIKSMGRKTVF